MITTSGERIQLCNLQEAKQMDDYVYFTNAFWCLQDFLPEQLSGEDIGQGEGKQNHCA